MLITTIEELRLHFPATAIDRIQILQGIIEDSESSVLAPVLGMSLYENLCDYYSRITPVEYVQRVSTGRLESVYEQLLLLSQHVIVNDAMKEAVGKNLLSINGAGVNMAVSEDYGKADKDSIRLFQDTCYKSCHRNINRLLVQLEQWCIRTDDDDDREEICEKWQGSDYYYLTSSLLIPTAEVLKRYVSFYDNREKFIAMLPDMHYIQEQQIAPVVGDGLLAALTEYGYKAKNDPNDRKFGLVRMLRSAMAAELESRTKVLDVPADRRQMRHSEFVQLLNRAASEIASCQEMLLQDYEVDYKQSPLYVPPVEQDADGNEGECTLAYSPQFRNNAKGSRFFATPFVSPKQ